MEGTPYDLATRAYFGEDVSLLYNFQPPMEQPDTARSNSLALLNRENGHGEFKPGTYSVQIHSPNKGPALTEKREKV